jgi:hypothetical protein
MYVVYVAWSFELVELALYWVIDKVQNCRFSPISNIQELRYSPQHAFFFFIVQLRIFLWRIPSKKLLAGSGELIDPIIRSRIGDGLVSQ